jgi:hypothetical protein
MRHTLLRIAVVGTLAVCLLAAMSMAAAAPALADSVYPSQHIALMPVGGAPLRTGFVENIHTNGPRIFALERYVLVGARPRTEYQVTIQIYGDPGATMSLGALPTVAFMTNGVGNGVGRFTLPLSGVDEALHGLTLYLVWELTGGGVVAYQTAISPVVLD